MHKLYEKIISVVDIYMNKFREKKVFPVLYLFVAFVTVYTLILPAFSIVNSRSGDIGLKIEENSEYTDPINNDNVNKIEDDNLIKQNNDSNLSETEIFDNLSPNIQDENNILGLNEIEKEKKSGLGLDHDQITNKQMEDENLYLDDTLEYTSKTYKVSVKINKDAKLPKDTRLEVSKIKRTNTSFERYEKKILQKIDKTKEEVGSVDLYDINLYSKGESVQPQAPVKVEITDYDEKDKENKVSNEEPDIIHFKDDGDLEIIKPKGIDNSKKLDAEVSFVANSFSIYAIVKPGQTVYRHTYIFETFDGNPYMFKFNNGYSSDRQIIKNGESLHGVGIPAIASGVHFNGWFEFDKDKNTFGDEVNFEVPINITEDRIIYVRPDYGNVAYATFYDNEDATVVLEKKQIPLRGGKGSIDLKDFSAASPSTRHTFAGWSLSKNGKIIEDNVDSYEIERDTEFYPIFKEAEKIEFNTGKIEEGAPYVAPRMVIKGKSAESVKPPDPKRLGYTFGGWYTEVNGAGEEFNFLLPVNKSVTLYAKWIPATANYTIVYWKQSKSDSKYATDKQKTYDYHGQKSGIGIVGTRVYLTDEDKKINTGFEYTSNHGETETIVKADGSSVMNVYFDRKLITMRFYKNIGEPKYNSRYWNDTTYTIIYTGLYGTSLEDNNYKWPDSQGYTWKYYIQGGTSKGMSYLGEFILPTDTKEDSEIRLYKQGDSQVSYYFYKQNIDGTYSQIIKDIGYGRGGIFTFTEKYSGFNVSAYRRSTSLIWYDSDWKKAAVDGTIETYYYDYYSIERPLNLHIRFERRKYKLRFLDPLNDQEINGFKSKEILYEAGIDGYKPDSSAEPKPILPGYKWDGKWYKDKTLTEEFKWTDKMPDHDMKVYAGFRKMTYKVTIDPNGGELGSNQETYFDVVYGEKISGYTDISRDYVEDSKGDFYYRYDTRENDPSKEKRAFYTKDANQQNINKNNKYRYEEKAYKLLGWYHVNKDGSTRPYNFNEPVVSDMTLKAVWRRVGDYKLKFSSEVYDYNKKQPLKDEDGVQVFAENIPEDGNTYDDQSHAVLPNRPSVGQPDKYRFRGWYYNGKIYNPYDEITIESKLADANKTITIHPVFKPVNDLLVEVTKITYDGNGGKRIENGQDVSSVEITQENGQDILVNQTVKTKDASYFKKTGYDLVGWNDSKEDANRGIAKFGFVQDIGLDNLDNKSNTLYAVWKPKTYTVTVTKKVIGNTSDKNKAFTFDPVGTLEGYNFSLKDGEKKTFESISYGSEIKIEEQIYDEFNIKEKITHKKLASEGEDKTYEATNFDKVIVDGDIDIVFTNERNKQDLLIQKVDIGNMNKALENAKFVLYPLDANDNRIEGEKIENIVSNSSGYLKVMTDSDLQTIQTLKTGNYDLVEIQAPDGYILEKEPVKISVTSTGVSVIQNGNEREVTEIDSTENTIYSTKITNSSGVELPKTGGMGENIFVACGLTLIISATLLLYIKKKKFMI